MTNPLSCGSFAGDVPKGNVKREPGANPGLPRSGKQDRTPKYHWFSPKPGRWASRNSDRVDRACLQVRSPASNHATPGVKIVRASEGRLAMNWRLLAFSHFISFP